MQYWVHCLESASKMGDELGNAWLMHNHCLHCMLHTIWCLQHPCAAPWDIRAPESLWQIGSPACLPLLQGHQNLSWCSTWRDTQIPKPSCQRSW